MPTVDETLHCTDLGHIIGGGHVRPEKSKNEAVRLFPIPLTEKDVRTYLGLSGYYTRFIDNYASLAAPLTDLTQIAAPMRVSGIESTRGVKDKVI